MDFTPPISLPFTCGSANRRRQEDGVPVLCAPSRGKERRNLRSIRNSLQTQWSLDCLSGAYTCARSLQFKWRRVGGGGAWEDNTFMQSRRPFIVRPSLASRVRIPAGFSYVFKRQQSVIDEAGDDWPATVLKPTTHTPPPARPRCVIYGRGLYVLSRF